LAGQRSRRFVVTKIDLDALRIGAPPARLPRRSWGPRLLSIAAILLLLAVAGTFAYPVVWPGRLVPMANVRAVVIVGPATAPLAEAVGWVEADPFATVVHSLVAGRVESIEVLEGATVTAGETVIAKLASAPLQAAVERAEASCRERERMVDAANAAHELAVARLAQNKDARLAASEARAALAAAEVALVTARGAIDRARAEARTTAASATAQEELHRAGSGNTVALERARAAAAAAEAAVKAAEATAVSATAERGAAKQRVDLAEDLVADPVDLKGAVAVTLAEKQRARANCDAGRAELAIAKRELAWAVVKAPVSGVVLRLTSHPGADAGPGTDGILSIYDPSHLRARIDVPLGSMGSITVDQEVELRSEVTGNTIVKGTVQRVQHEADLLKNTLQVKVRLLDPPPLWRPETLCRARFLSPTKPADANATTSAFVVPKAALQGDRVFVFDPQRSRVRGVPVTKITDQGDDVVVKGDLSVTQRVALQPVTDNETIRDEGR